MVRFFLRCGVEEFEQQSRKRGGRGEKQGEFDGTTVIAKDNFVSDREEI